MQVRRALLPFAIFVCLAVTAQGQITRISPNPVPYGVVEENLTIFGTNLGGALQTFVTYNGPTGELTLEANFASPTTVIVFIPFDIAFTAGDYTVTILAVDSETSTRTIGPASFTVAAPPDVETPPLIALPEIVVAEADSSRGTFVGYHVEATSGDGNVALTPSCSPESGSLFSIGLTTVQCSVSDEHGTTQGSFLVLVGDTTPPVVNLPDNIITDQSVVTWTTTAHDAIDGDLNVTCNPPSGSSFRRRTTTVTCFAMDSHFNVGGGFFTVTVTNGSPLLTLPSDITAEATSSAGAVVEYEVSSHDGSAVTCNPASGSTFPLGPTTVSCSATNSFGTTTGTFKVTVVDTTPPVISGAADIVADATSPAGANVTYALTATDVVSGSVGVTCTPASGSFFNLGETVPVTCTASDSAGNVAQEDFTVTVLDLSPPTVTSIDVNPKVLWPPDHKMVNFTVTITATDIVDPAPVSKIVSITSNQPINGTGDGDTAPDWAITGDLTGQLRAERAGSNDRIYTIKVETTDSSGNTTLSTVTVRVTNVKSRSAR